MHVPDQSGSSKKTVFKEDSFDPLLPQFTFATILKNKNKIVSAYEEGVYNNKCKKTKDPSYLDLDKALAQRLHKVRGLNVAVNGTLLAEKARFFAKELGNANFKASRGYLEKFKFIANVDSKLLNREAHWTMQLRTLHQLV